MKDLLILATNDDGVEAGGLRAMADELKPLGKVVVVAPHDERSAVGHGLTIHQPLRLFERQKNYYALTGTPVDCVLFALRKLLPRMPDLIVSGINHGANLGDDVHYSGTVAGAREGALYGIPSIATSLVTVDSSPDFSQAAKYLKRVVLEFYPERIPPGTFLNVNVPEGNPSRHRFTRQGTKLVTSSIEEKRDPRGRKYFWIGRDDSEWVVEADTDYQAVRDGAVSITPLHRDQTDYRALKNLGKDS